MQYNYQNKNEPPAVVEKVISVASYWTMGFAGFIWLIIAMITKRRLKSFVKYHVYQSIFLSVLFFVIRYVLDILFSILSFVPGIKNIIGLLTFAFNVSIPGINLSIVALSTLLLLLYLSVGVLMNRYSYLPWISSIIAYNTERG